MLSISEFPLYYILLKYSVAPAISSKYLIIVLLHSKQVLFTLLLLTGRGQNMVGSRQNWEMMELLIKILQAVV